MRAIGIKLNCNRRMCCVKSLTITLTLAVYVIVTNNYYYYNKNYVLYLVCLLAYTSHSNLYAYSLTTLLST